MALSWGYLFFKRKSGALFKNPLIKQFPLQIR